MFVDGVEQRSLSFHGGDRTIDFGEKYVLDGLGSGAHTIRIVMHRGDRGYVEGFTDRR